jgi:hypothetical protein
METIRISLTMVSTGWRYNPEGHLRHCEKQRFKMHFVGRSVHVSGLGSVQHEPASCCTNLVYRNFPNDKFDCTGVVWPVEFDGSGPLRIEQ